jgi:hypothetical protein
MKFQVIVLLGLLMFASCTKEKEAVPMIDSLVSNQNAMVLNEGNFQWGNASTTIIQYVNNEVTNDLFQKVNNRPLGDVLNSGTKSNVGTFLVVNNSGKIEKMDSPLRTSTVFVEGLHSPRFIAAAGTNKFYVTDLYANRIHILDGSGNLTGHIPVNGWTEQLVNVSTSIIWVCNVSRGKILKLDVSTDQIVDSIQVGDSPRWIVQGYGNSMWILCEGEVYPNETSGSLWGIDSETKQVIYEHHFAQTEHPSSLVYSSAPNAEIYYLLNGVNRISLGAVAPQPELVIPQEGRLFYSLSANLEELWVTDAKDYVQSGEVLRYSKSGSLIAKYPAGIIPSQILFY